MVIERKVEEVIIRLPADIDTEGLQNLIDYLTYIEVTGKSKAKQIDIDELTKDIKKGWWEKNRGKLTK